MPPESSLQPPTHPGPHRVAVLALDDSAAAPDASAPDGAAPTPRRPRIHRAWFVAAVAFVTILGAAAFRSLPGLLIDPLNDDFRVVMLWGT